MRPVTAKMMIAMAKRMKTIKLSRLLAVSVHVKRTGVSSVVLVRWSMCAFQRDPVVRTRGVTVLIKIVMDRRMRGLWDNRRAAESERALRPVN
tara:strand:+ start:416 stop:694 length:279 start_codon:yes stop_codon:yes gene_type:complete